MSASFHKHEESFEHQNQIPEAPPPETLPSVSDLMARMLDQLPQNMRKYWQNEPPIDTRMTDVSRYLDREPREPKQMVWLRANGSLDANPLLHQAILAYASDFTLLDTALIAHGKLLLDRDIQLASIDHAMWFHRPFRADQWMLYVQDSPNAYGARGFCRGSVYSRDGTLIASVAQEGLMRKRETAYLMK